MKLIYVILIILTILLVFYFLFIRQLYSSDLKITGNKHIFADKLMIVAHPDDELLFGGGELLKEKGWKVVCITNGTAQSGNIFKPWMGQTRKEEFIKVMNKLGCRYEIWDFEDNGLSCNWNKEKLIGCLKRVLGEKNYKKVVTHNLAGEYGHVQHKEISRLLHELKPKNLHVFHLNKSKKNPYIDKINSLFELYSSQANVFKQHYKYALYQDCIKI